MAKFLVASVIVAVAMLAVTNGRHIKTEERGLDGNFGQEEDGLSKQMCSKDVMDLIQSVESMIAGVLNIVQNMVAQLGGSLGGGNQNFNGNNDGFQFPGWQGGKRPLQKLVQLRKQLTSMKQKCVKNL